MQYNDEPFSYVIMDTNLQFEFNEKFILPLKERKFEIIQTDVGNSGFIYMLAKVVRVAKRKSSKTHS